MHGLIYLTQDNRKNLDVGNIGCGIFVDLQKAFGNVEHDNLLARLEDHGIRGLANNGLDPIYPTESNMFQLINIICIV